MDIQNKGIFDDDKNKLHRCSDIYLKNVIQKQDLYYFCGKEIYNDERYKEYMGRQA